jgi:starch synthase
LSTQRLATLTPVRIVGLTVAPTVERLVAPGGLCEVLLLREDEWYDRPGGIYRDPEYVEYSAVTRAVFYGFCAEQWVHRHAVPYDLVHANDWQSGMGLYLISRARTKRAALTPRLLYNIYSAEYRGYLDKDDLSSYPLTEGDRAAFLRSIDGDDPCLMVAGMAAADRIVTCSPTYGVELADMLANTAMRRLAPAKSLTGILSGIDPGQWDPGQVAVPAARYGVANVIGGKSQNKRALQRNAASRYRIGSRSSACARGSCAKKESISSMPPSGTVWRPLSIQLVVMGVGEVDCRQALERLKQAFPTLVHYWPTFEPLLARLLYAGSDATLMPSLVEPCGLNRMISMRYGTVPIVFAGRWTERHGSGPPARR